MKEIKFRSWDTEREVMAKVSHIGLNDYEVGMEDDNCRCWSAPYPYVCKLMQCIGIKDKKDNEIYEGDIVTFKQIFWNNCNKDYIEYEMKEVGEIVDYFGYGWAIKSKQEDGCAYYPLTHLLGADYEIEVIGNIFENKDLL